MYILERDMQSLSRELLEIADWSVFIIVIKYLQIVWD